jgi:hypothetical protein
LLLNDALRPWVLATRADPIADPVHRALGGSDARRDECIRQPERRLRRFPDAPRSRISPTTAASPRRHAFNGLTRVVVRSRQGKAGTILLRTSDDGLEPEQVVIRTQR